MTRRFTVSIIAVLLLVIVPGVLFAQRTRQQPTPQRTTPTKSDLKITYRSTMSGQTSEMTTMLKGSRERSEMQFAHGLTIVNVTQCDLKQTLQISDSAKKYIITPMDSEDASPTNAAAGGGTVAPSRRGGVVTYTTTSIDTGERKEMFGFQARHVKRTISIQSSPDACNPVNQKMETDGWYIDASFGLVCEAGAAPIRDPMSRGGCRDHVRIVQEGSGRTGYPLQETTTMYGPNGSVMFTSTKEVFELSREPLDPALFDIPAGYTETQNPQELYGMPSMDQIAQMANRRDRDESDNSNVPVSKPAGALRVGVAPINNRSGGSLSTDALRDRLVGQIQNSGIDAVPLNAISASEADVEARAKQCDFILYTDLAGLKTSASKKLGSIFGRATGVGGVASTEAKVEFKLFAVGNPSAVLQSSASAKEEGEDASAGSALESEARQVVTEVRKRRG